MFHCTPSQMWLVISVRSWKLNIWINMVLCLSMPDWLPQNLQPATFTLVSSNHSTVFYRTVSTRSLWSSSSSSSSSLPTFADETDMLPPLLLFTPTCKTEKNACHLLWHPFQPANIHVQVAEDISLWQKGKFNWHALQKNWQSMSSIHFSVLMCSVHVISTGVCQITAEINNRLPLQDGS